MAIAHAISTTERLVLILQSITLKQLTGCLSIEHVSVGGNEKGEIFFVKGDTVFARTEQGSGKAALIQMLKWREVRYTFFAGLQPPQTYGKFDRIILHSSTLRHLLTIDMEETREAPSIGILASSGDLPHPLSVPVTAPHIPTLPQVSALPAPPRTEIRHTISRGASAVFRTRPYVTTPTILKQLERRDRIVLLLLDGKRTLHDVAHLVSRSELDIATVLARMFKRGYIEYIRA
ncbi:MAG: DUF4388 domain-containing protein [Ktedonobacteraceae bacterium]